MKDKSFKNSLFALMALGLATNSSAVVQLIFTGTVDSDATGTFSVNDPITLTYTLSDDTNAGTEDFSSDSSNNNWGIDTVGQPSLWHSVTGTNLVGTWTEGSENSDSPRDAIGVVDGGGLPNDILFFSTGIDSGTSIGFTLGGNNVTRIFTSGFLNGLDVPFSLGGYTNPNDYFDDHLSTYVATGLNGSITTDGGSVSFTGTSLDIITVAIPEPSSVGVLILPFILGFTVCRRRRS